MKAIMTSPMHGRIQGYSFRGRNVERTLCRNPLSKVTTYMLHNFILYYPVQLSYRFDTF